MLQRLNLRVFLTAAAIAVMLFTLPGYTVHAQEAPGERVAVLSFWAFDQQGNLIPRASETDLARLGSVLPRAISARLVQSGVFDVIDDTLLEAYNKRPATGEQELERVKVLFEQDEAEQVIVGSIAQIQQAVVTSVQRYVPGPEGPRLVGSAVVRSNSASETVNSVEQLLSQLFPPDSDVVLRPISRVVVVPNALRIPVGGSAPVQAYAMDDLGRTLSTVTLIFQTSDETRALVDQNGVISGASPGRAQINVQPLGRPLAANAALPKIDVTVVGPSLGLRAGTSATPGDRGRPRIGLRLTPGHEIKTSAATTQALPQAGSNPINVLTSFFGSLLGNQMLTVDLDVVPAQDISMTLNAVQRTPRSYFGTGIGVAVPMDDEGASGVILRLTMGAQLPVALRANMTHPIEINADFLLGGAQNAPKARIGVSVGIDLFQ